MYGHHGCLSAIQSKLQLHSSVIDIQHQALIKCGCYIHICPVIRKHHIRIGKYMCHMQYSTDNVTIFCCISNTTATSVVIYLGKRTFHVSQRMFPMAGVRQL